MSSNKKKGKLDPITFIYGFGAAVVLVGAMFKFYQYYHLKNLYYLGNLYNSNFAKKYIESSKY